MPSVSLSYPPRILFGQDVFQKLGSLASGLARRALVITESVMRTESYLGKALESLAASGVEAIVFDSIPPGGASVAINEASELVRASKPQLVIGLGGVRVLSAARLAANEGSKNWPATTAPLRYIEVPSSCRDPLMFRNEVIVNDSATGLPQVKPLRSGLTDTIIFDPGLTQSLSPRFFSVAMLDILLASAEGYLASSANFYSDTLLEKSIERIGDALLNSLRSSGKTLERVAVCEAGLLSALGLMSSNIGIGNALAFAINSRLRVPKSWVSSILLPHVLELYIESSAPRLAKIAAWLGEDTQGRHASAVAGRALDATRRFLGLLKLPSRLRDLNLELSDLAAISEAALNLPFARSGPVRLEEASVSALLERAF